MTEREHALLELLVEATRPKTDRATTRMDHPSQQGHGLRLASSEADRDTRLRAELTAEREHWKGLAQESAQTIRELHEELQRAEASLRIWQAKAAELADASGRKP